MRVSAGGIIQGPDGRIVIVHNHGQSWGFPKGGLEDGENFEECALRESVEETGLTDLTIVSELPVYERPSVKHGRTELHMFLMQTTQTELSPHDEHITEARWASKQAAMKLLTHQKDKHILEEALCQC